jgi:hypothetical protein
VPQSAKGATPRRRKADHTSNGNTAGDTRSLRMALARREETRGDSLESPKRIGEMLVEDGVITRDQLDAALELQRRGGEGDRIGEILVASGVASAEQIHTTA